MGGHISECSKCDYKDQSYNSCRNRHCLKCQFNKKEKWVQRRVEELIPVVIPSGGINEEKKTWIKTKKKFLLPIRVLSLVFRGKHLSFLEKEYQNGNLEFHGRCEYLKEEKHFK